MREREHKHRGETGPGDHHGAGAGEALDGGAHGRLELEHLEAVKGEYEMLVCMSHGMLCVFVSILRIMGVSGARGRLELERRGEGRMPCVRMEVTC